MEKTARLMARAALIVAAITLVVLIAIAVAAALGGCGRIQSQSSRDTSVVASQEAESNQLNARDDSRAQEDKAKELPGDSLGPNFEIGKDLIIQCWLLTEDQLMSQLLGVLREVKDRIDVEPEGSSTIPEGADADCLIRWSKLVDPFGGYPADYFASQLPGWQCHVELYFKDPSNETKERAFSALAEWYEEVVSSSSDRVSLDSQYLSAVFERRLVIPSD